MKVRVVKPDAVPRWRTLKTEIGTYTDMCIAVSDTIEVDLDEMVDDWMKGNVGWTPL